MGPGTPGDPGPRQGCKLELGQPVTTQGAEGLMSRAHEPMPREDPCRLVIEAAAGAWVCQVWSF